MPNILLANELSTNGGAKQFENLTDLSFQRRADGQALNGAYSWWFKRPADGSEISPWWSEQRDRDLRLFVLREGNDILQGAVSSINKKFKAMSWVVDGPKRVVPRVQETLANSEFGDGWSTLISKTLQDFHTQDKGATWELIGPGNPDGPLVGLPVGVAHLDAQFVQPTGDPTYPILFHNPKDSKSHKIHVTRCARFVDMPSPNELMCGLGFCAVSRVIASSQILMKLARYKNEKLSDMPEAGLLVLNNILPHQFEDVRANHQRGQRKLGNEIWSNIMTLFSIDPAQPAKAEFVSFADLPEGFDDLTSTNLYVNVVALSFGYDVREFWPVSEGGLGTGAETKVQSQKAKGKGEGEIISMIERVVNQRVLPPSCHFAFDFKDDQEDELRAKINREKTETIWGMWDSQSYQGGLEPPVSILEIRQMLANNVPDYFLEEFLQVDITDDESIDDTEQAKMYGGKVRIDARGKRIQRERRESDEILGVAIENFKAGRISLDDLIEFKLGKVLDERSEF